MKKLKQISLAVIVTLTLALPVLAGDIGIGKGEQPPPPPLAATTTASDMPIDIADETQVRDLASDSVTHIALSMLQAVLTMF